MEVKGMWLMARIVAYSILASSSAMAQTMSKSEAGELARTTLAKELEVDANVLALVSVEQVEWPNSALGCPEKGRYYLQVMTPGYRVSFRYGDRLHHVNVGNRRAVYCTGAAKKPGLAKKERLEPALLVSRMAQRDLASRLGVDVSRIKIALIEPTIWQDAGLGCAEEGKSYEKVETDGYLIELELEGETYEYHSDKEKPRLCEKPS
jgi:hypothetical protein